MILLTIYRDRQVLAQKNALHDNGVSCGQSLGQAIGAVGVFFRNLTVTHDTRYPSPFGLGFPQVEPIFALKGRLNPPFYISPSQPFRLGLAAVAMAHVCAE